MAFSLNDVSSIKKVKQADALRRKQIISNCFALIRNYENITDVVRNALEVYLEDRLRTRSNTNLSANALNDNIKELLEYCCTKRYDVITLEDVKINEVNILKHIKDSIEHKNTKTLLWNPSAECKDYRDMGTSDIFEPRELTDEEVYKYFELRRQLYG